MSPNLRSLGSLPVWAHFAPSPFEGEGWGEGRSRLGLGSASRVGSSRWGRCSDCRSFCCCSGRSCSGRSRPDRPRPPRRRGLERFGVSSPPAESGGEGRAAGGAADSAFGGAPAGLSLSPDFRQGRNRERPFGLVDRSFASGGDIRVAAIVGLGHPDWAARRRRGITTALERIHAETKKGRTPMSAAPRARQTEEVENHLPNSVAPQPVAGQ